MEKLTERNEGIIEDWIGSIIAEAYPHDMQLVYYSDTGEVYVHPKYQGVLALEEVHLIDEYYAGTKDFSYDEFDRKTLREDIMEKFREVLWALEDKNEG